MNYSGLAYTLGGAASTGEAVHSVLAVPRLDRRDALGQ